MLKALLAFTEEEMNPWKKMRSGPEREAKRRKMNILSHFCITPGQVSVNSELGRTATFEQSSSI